MASRNTSRDLQNEWRRKLPSLHNLVNRDAPRHFEAVANHRLENVSDSWKGIVASMKERVHRDLANADFHDEDTSKQHRRGWHWGSVLMDFCDMVEYLTREILDDIEMPQGETLASVALLNHATSCFRHEMHSGGDEPTEHLVAWYRRQKALEAFTARLDSVLIRRVHALEKAEAAATITQIPSKAELDEAVKAFQRRWPDKDADSYREYLQTDSPALDGVLAKFFLSQIHERFEDLDPLVALEEFAEAKSSSKGGRASNGEGQTGATRALARVSVTCGALGFEQRADETFDDAVERARKSLLMARSTVLKMVKGFPGIVENDDQ